MPNDGNRIYSETRGGIKYGVDLLADVCPVLGISTADVGYACSNRHGKIAMWAKYKPVDAPIPVWNLHKKYISRMSGGKEEWVESNTDGAVEGWRGSKGDCGIQVAATTAVGTIGSADCMWTYNSPTRYFNLAHFDGYRHNATGPFRGITYSGKEVFRLTQDSAPTVEVYSGQTVEVALTPSIAVSDGSVLTLADLRIDGMTSTDTENLGQAYFGIAVFSDEACSPQKYKYFFTADTAGARELQWQVEHEATGENLWIVPVLAKNRQRRRNDNGGLASLVANVLLRVPEVPVAKVRYVSKEEAVGVHLNVTARASVSQNTIRVYCDVTVRNSGTQTYIPTNLVVELLLDSAYKDGENIDYPFGNPNDTGTGAIKPIIGIDPGQERGRFFNFTANGYRQGMTVEVRARMQPGGHTVTRMVIMPAPSDI